MKRNTLLTIQFLFTGIMWISCNKDEDPVNQPPPVTNESELITTVKLIFTDSATASNIKTATFRDPDGDGGKGADIHDTIRLDPGKTWNTELLLLNETTSPVDTISKEVLEEAEDHILCYTPGGNSATVFIMDKDANNRPVGLRSRWKTSPNTGIGTMQIILKHQPEIKDGSCTPGETDAEVTFHVKVQ